MKAIDARKLTIGIAFLLLAFSMALAQGGAGRPVAAMPVVQSWQLCKDPNEGAFQLEMPKGWKTGCGTNRWNALQFRSWATAVSPDGSTLLQIGDTEKDSYMNYSSLLPAARGYFPVGSTYQANVTQYIVYPYQSAPQYAAIWAQGKLSAICTSIRVTGSQDRPDLEQPLSKMQQSAHFTEDAGEATLTCQRNGMELTAYTFLRVDSLGGGIWYPGDIHLFVAPTPFAGMAAGLMAHMTNSFRESVQWLARQSNMAADAARIDAQANAAISDSIMKRWESQSAAQSRIWDESDRVREGIDVYADPATGQQYTVPNTSNYYWIDAGGNVVGTATDSAPGAGYTRMKRVPPK